MAAAGKSEGGAPLPAELAAPASTSPDETVVKVDAEEFARQESQREVVERAWREQEDYVRDVAELKEKIARSESRRARAIAAAILIAAVALGVFLYNHQLAQDRATKADALRIAAESLARREEESRAKPAPAAEPAEDSAARARAAAEAKKAAEKAKALALKIEDEARRMAELAAKKQAAAMAQSEERARAQAAVNVKEAPRAVPRPGTVFQDCADCPRMVIIPAGEFTMGSPASEAGRGFDEGPQRQVSIALYALGRTEVTVAEFRRFADESGFNPTLSLVA